MTAKSRVVALLNLKFSSTFSNKEIALSAIALVTGIHWRSCSSVTVTLGIGRDVSCTDSKDLVVGRARKFEDEFGEA